MKILARAFLAIFLTFSMLITGFGYANLSSSLSVSGVAHSSAQSGIFISDVITKELINATESVNGYVQRVLNTTVTLGDSDDAAVIYTVEFFNNDSADMAYYSMTYDKEAYDNSSLAFTVSDVLDGAVIAKGGKLTLTLKIAKNEEASVSGALNAIVSFVFGEIIVFEDETGKFEPGENYNKLVATILSNSNGYGLNDDHKGYVIHDALEKNKTLYSIDNVQGGNIDKMLNSLQSATANIDFIFEYINENEYAVYLFSRSDAVAGNNATVYRQLFHFDGNEWVTGSALVGYAKMKSVRRPKGSLIAFEPSEWIIGDKPNT